MNIIGFDFSINKPAACIFANETYKFISWPYGISDKHLKVFSESGITIVERTDNKDKGNNISEKMRYEVENALYISRLIIDSIKPYLNEDTIIAFEGLSYASKGDVVLQLGGYKYILMAELSKYMSTDNMYTYSPITIKSIAGCAKKGMGKIDMINKFIEEGPDCQFRDSLRNEPDIFKTPKSKNWIVHIDDLVDAYWVIQTILKKEVNQVAL